MHPSMHLSIYLSLLLIEFGINSSRRMRSKTSSRKRRKKNRSGGSSGSILSRSEKAPLQLLLLLLLLLLSLLLLLLLLDTFNQMCRRGPRARPGSDTRNEKKGKSFSSSSPSSYSYSSYSSSPNSFFFLLAYSIAWWLSESTTLTLDRQTSSQEK